MALVRSMHTGNRRPGFFCPGTGSGPAAVRLGADITSRRKLMRKRRVEPRRKAAAEGKPEKSRNAVAGAMFGHKTFVTLAAVCALAALVGGGLWRLGVFSDYATYKDRQNKFSIEYPNSWEVVLSPLGVEVAFVSPQVPGDSVFRDNVNIHVQAGHVDIASKGSFVAQQIDELKLAGTEFRILSAGDFMVADLPASFLSCNIKIGDDDLLILTSVVSSDNTYFITCTTKQSNSASMESQCYKFVKSFKIL